MIIASIVIVASIVLCIYWSYIIVIEFWTAETRVAESNHTTSLEIQNQPSLFTRTFTVFQITFQSKTNHHCLLVPSVPKLTHHCTSTFTVFQITFQSKTNHHCLHATLKCLFHILFRSKTNYHKPYYILFPFQISFTPSPLITVATTAITGNIRLLLLRCSWQLKEKSPSKLGFNLAVKGKVPF